MWHVRTVAKRWESGELESSGFRTNEWNLRKAIIQLARCFSKSSCHYASQHRPCTLDTDNPPFGVTAVYGLRLRKLIREERKIGLFSHVVLKSFCFGN